MSSPSGSHVTGERATGAGGPWLVIVIVCVALLLAAFLALEHRSPAPLVYARTMRHLRVWIRLLAALLLACVAHIVTDGLTPGLALGMALTALLLLAALGLWRIGSRRKPEDTAPPGIEP
jgi:hypothetical protein